MTRTVDVPHKILFSGSYTVLDGYPALGLAVGPRMTLQLTKEAPQPWPEDNPFARAVDVVMSEALKVEGATPHDRWGSFTTSLPEEVYGWGLGSSAAFTTALCAAIALEHDINTPTRLFALACAAHRLGQGGKGSGVDIAACTFGGLVYVTHAQGDTAPRCAPFPWPRDLGILLLRSGQKADTREKITSYRDIPPQTKQRANRPLLRAIGGVCRAFVHHKGILAALRENARCEGEWSQALGIPLVTTQQRALETELYKALPTHDIVLKALGAGGGDSIACFYDKRHTQPAAIAPVFTQAGLQVRDLPIELHGVREIPQLDSQDTKGAER